MKYRFLFLMGLILTNVQAQNVDSLATKQVDSLILVSRKWTEQKEFEKAMEANQAAMQIVSNIFGKESPAFASVAFNTGRINYFMEKPNEAETWYRQSIQIRKRVSGKMNLDYVKTASNLADICRIKAKYQEANSLYLEADSIATLLLGKINPIRLSILGNLGHLYELMGYFEKEILIRQESAKISDAIFSSNSTEYAASLNSLGNVYHFLGDDASAEEYYRKALALYLNLEGKVSMQYVGSLINLATITNGWGGYDKGVPMLEEAREILENKLQDTHNDFYRNCLGNLMIGYQALGKLEKATELCKLRLQIFQEMVGRTHPKIADELSSLAGLYRISGRYSDADSLYKESISIFERVEGNSDTKLIVPLMGLAMVSIEKNELSKAEAYALEANQMLIKVSKRMRGNYISNLFMLAELQERLGKSSEAERSFNMACSEVRDQLRTYSAYQSEKVLETCRMAYSTRLSYINTIIFYRNLKKQDLGTLPSVSYNQGLFEKGFLLSAASHLIQTSSQNPEFASLFEQLKGVRRQLYRDYSNNISDNQQTRELEEKADLLEKELTRKISSYGEAFQPIKWQMVQKALQPGTAAIEFVHFLNYQNNRSGDAVYGAMLLLPENNQPHFIPLFEEKYLDSLLNTKSDRKSDYVNSLYTLADRGVIAIEAPKKSLYDLIWKPLEKELTGIKTIYFSPSGLLHRINLDAIPISETETLADNYQLIELYSTRQLVIPTKVKIAKNDAVLFGGIQYTQDSTLQNNEPLLASISRGEVSFNSIDSTLRGGNWNYLAGTEREVNSIEKIMQTAGIQTTLKKGYQATEESFKNIGANNSASPRILHIATHGYFFPDPKDQLKASGLSSQNESVFKISDHPMLRSGLIMAGGNAAWQGKNTLEGKEDGILTAYEISQMNLSNTELVVLSACETGLGDIQGNEGVYGLQRAFKIAGAKYLIMSLWQVPDKQTSMLMTTFYKKWLEDKMAIPDAFNAAQKELRDIGLDPYQWAGFVLVE